MRILRFVAVVAVGGVSSACATTPYTQSRFETVPSRAKGRAGTVASLEIEGLTVRIETLDRAPQGKAPGARGVAPPFTLRVALAPRVLGYSFDPGQVVLRAADGREWRSAQAGYELVQPGASYDLRFDAAVDHGTRFELVLGGLARGPRRLEPVTLTLVRREGRSIDRIYWLEAIGWVIAVSTYP